MDYLITEKINAGYPYNYHILGIFTDKKTNHINNTIDSDIRQNITNSIKNAEFSGKIGAYQIFHSSKNKVMIFGLGDKKKFNSSLLSKAIFHTIKKISSTKY